MERRHFAQLPILIALAVMAFKYFTAEKVTNPLTGKTARVALSTQQEESLGVQSYQEVLSHSEVVSSGPAHDLVVGVAKKLAPVTGEAAKNYRWQVSLVNS